jgi:hypothetical protein
VVKKLLMRLQMAKMLEKQKNKILMLSAIANRQK